MTSVDLFFAVAQVGSTAVTVAVVFGPGLIAAAAAVGCRAILRAHYQRRDNRTAAVEQMRQARIADIQLRWAQETAVIDEEPGINVGLRDQCDQLYRLPAREEQS